MLIERGNSLFRFERCHQVPDAIAACAPPEVLPEHKFYTSNIRDRDSTTSACAVTARRMPQALMLSYARFPAAVSPRLAAIEKLREFICPDCRSSGLQFELADETTGGTGVRFLVCGKCSARFPLCDDIPYFAPQLNYAGSFGFQWNEHSKTQLDSYTGMNISRDRLFGVSDWPRDLHGQEVLEAGAGAGRFTEILLRTGARIFAFDYSTAVTANWSNNGGLPNLVLFQADIYRIPLRAGRFDKVLCLGVLQHTPSPERAFKSLAEMVRPGGELVIDVYARRLSSLLHWKYLLRPLTRRINPKLLHRIVAAAVPPLLPLAAILRRVAGAAGARLLPIIEYSHLGLPPELNREWAVLDTFDMYSPAHDHPQTLATVRGWYERAGFIEINVRHGPNGVIGKGRRPVVAEPT